MCYQLNLPVGGHSSNGTHLLLTVSITWPKGQAQPGTQRVRQVGLLSQVRGHGDAQVVNSCPSTSAHSGSSFTGWHWGQHSPSGTTSSSPSSQTGFRQRTAEQSGESGTHWGQHWPSGTTSSSPSSQTCFRQRTAEQSGTHWGQHWPSGTSVFSPGLHTGKRQSTVEQSGGARGTHWGQHSPPGTSVFSPSLQIGIIQETAAQSGGRDQYIQVECQVAQAPTCMQT